MFDGLRYLFSKRPPWIVGIDILDILVVAYLIYRILLVLRGTRAMQMAVGLGLLLGLYLFGRYFQMVTLTSAFSTLGGSIIVVVVVVFQNDIRRGLMRAGDRGSPWQIWAARADETRVIDEIVAAAAELARLRYGAIITWERQANLDEFRMNPGKTLDAYITRELLVTIFNPVAENKLHDGAVIIRNLRIAYAGVFFAMPEKASIDQKFGSRHRAGMGITADTDAIAIVVSEERGTIMFCFKENHVDDLTPDLLRGLLLNDVSKARAKKATSTTRRSVPPSSRSRTSRADGVSMLQSGENPQAETPSTPPPPRRLSSGNFEAGEDGGDQ